MYHVIRVMLYPNVSAHITAKHFKKPLEHPGRFSIAALTARSFMIPRRNVLHVAAISVIICHGCGLGIQFSTTRHETPNEYCKGQRCLCAYCFTHMLIYVQNDR